MKPLKISFEISLILSYKYAGQFREIFRIHVSIPLYLQN